MTKIIPAILAGDPLDLEDKLKRLKSLSDWVHIDVADGNFVDNTSIQLKDLSKSKLAGGFKLEAHLMAFNPEKYFKECQKAGVKRVVFHLEAAENLADILAKAENFTFQKGIALNPETPIVRVGPYLKQVDSALLLSVRPGFQGQKFIPSVLDKIKKLRKEAPRVKIGVDGGIHLKNAGKIAKVGADYLVVGSHLFQESKNIKGRLEQLRDEIA